MWCRPLLSIFVRLSITMYLLVGDNIIRFCFAILCVVESCMCCLFWLSITLCAVVYFGTAIFRGTEISCQSVVCLVVVKHVAPAVPTSRRKVIRFYFPMLCVVQTCTFCLIVCPSLNYRRVFRLPDFRKYIPAQYSIPGI